MLRYLILGVFTILLSCVLWYALQFWKYGHLNQFGGPMPLPFIGNYLLLRDSNCALDQMMKLFNEYGSIVKVWLGSEFYLLISDAELSQLTLKHSKIAYKDTTYEFYDRWFGFNGQFLTNGDAWRKYRNITLQTLHMEVIKNRMKDISSQCDIFIKNLFKINQYKQIVDMEPIYQALIIDIFDMYAFDSKMAAQNKQHGYNYLQALIQLSHNIIIRSYSTWKRFNFFYQFSSDYKKESEDLKVIYDTADQIINKHKRIIHDDNIEVIKSNAAAKQRYKFAIDHVLQSTINGRPITQNEAYHYINGMIMAATETTAGTLSWLTYELSQNEEVQNKLVDEIQEVFGNETDQSITISDINQLKYMDLVIKETLRYYSPVPLFARRLNEDIKFRGTTIPKNTGLIYVPSGFHRSERYFRDPDRFYPERFLDENKMAPFSFMAFSAGDRICPGIKFGTVMMKLTLVYLLRNFVIFSAGSEYRPQTEMGIILSSQNGFHVQIRSRV